ncbi:MAG: hypothetical protein AUJ85_05460 [Elusimicrobia bacterium CG1_02_37_114]|nr:MAG: hypothetical protein AUJ85_05460 [Elusimicrobia bacterium CG1_02_37_114]
MEIRFKLLFPTGYSVDDICENGNIDAHIILDNGNVYAATFITPTNIMSLMDNCEYLDERNYLYIADMIIVRDLKLSSMKEAVSYLIKWEKLNVACEKIAERASKYSEYENFDSFDSNDIK